MAREPKPAQAWNHQTRGSPLLIAPEILEFKPIF